MSNSTLSRIATSFELNSVVFSEDQISNAFLVSRYVLPSASLIHGRDGSLGSHINTSTRPCESLQRVFDSGRPPVPPF